MTWVMMKMMMMIQIKILMTNQLRKKRKENLVIKKKMPKMSLNQNVNNNDFKIII